MTDYPVSNDGQFSSARSSAGAGDTITLANGTYSGFTWASKSVSTSNRLTIQAANPGNVVISSTVTLNGVVGVDWIGIHFDTGVEHSFGTNSHMLFQYCKVDGIFRYDGGHDLTFQYCRFDNCGFWPGSSPTYNILFDENYHYSRSGDNIRIDGAHDITIQNSVFYDVLGSGPTPHWDLCVQGLTANGITPYNITIRGNIAIDNAATLIIDSNTGQPLGGGGGPQAYFLGGPSSGYQNILVEKNMAITNNSNGVRLTNPSTNCIVRNNSLILCSVVYNTSSGGYVSPLLQDNLALAVLEEAGSSGPAPTLSGNVTYSGGAATDIYDDPGTTVYDILDYRRFISSAYPTKGAAARIAEIQAGTNVYALNLAGMPAVGGGSPSPSISGLTINLASA